MVMWHEHLIDQDNIISSYLLIKLVSLPELALIIHTILLELIPCNYNDYKLIPNIISTDARTIAKQYYNIDL